MYVTRVGLRLSAAVGGLRGPGSVWRGLGLCVYALRPKSYMSDRDCCLQVDSWQDRAPAGGRTQHHVQAQRRWSPAVYKSGSAARCRR
jgi:hypothetical protein